MSKPPGDATVAELFGAHAPALLLYARQWVGAEEAEDVVQRVFVRLLTGRRLPSDPRTWLFRCVRNEAIDAWRSIRRRGRREHVAARDAPGWFVPSPEDGLDARDAQAALNALPPEEREVIVLRLWSGLTLSETAAVVGVAVSIVHHRFESAIEALRQKLEAPCENQDP